MWGFHGSSFLTLEFSRGATHNFSEFPGVKALKIPVFFFVVVVVCLFVFFFSEKYIINSTHLDLSGKITQYFDNKKESFKGETERIFHDFRRAFSGQKFSDLKVYFPHPRGGEV